MVKALTWSVTGQPTALPRIRWSRWWPSDIANASQVSRYRILSCIGPPQMRDGGSDTVSSTRTPRSGVSFIAEAFSASEQRGRRVGGPGRGGQVRYEAHGV